MSLGLASKIPPAEPSLLAGYLSLIHATMTAEVAKLGLQSEN